MKHLIILLAFTTISYAEVPTKLSRLQDQREKAIKSIDKTYVENLQNLLKEYTKKGDLDSANQVNKIIISIEEKHNTKILPNTDKKLKRYLNDSRWEFPEKKIITFKGNGIIDKSWGKNTPNWVVKNMQVMCEGKIFSFNKDFTSMTEISKKEFKGKAFLIK